MAKRSDAPRPFSFVTGYIPETYGEVVFYTTKPHGSSAHLGADVVVPKAAVDWRYDPDTRSDFALIVGRDDHGRTVLARTRVTPSGDDVVEHLVVDGKDLLARI